jgi:cysteine desulfurase
VADRVYLDHVASTPLDPEAREAMLQALGTSGNPSSLHLEGRRARDLVELSRERVAGALGCRPREVVFASGATEALNLALRGAALARAAAGAPRRVVVTAVEHPAVLDVAGGLSPEGFEVVRVPPAPDGSVSADAFDSALEPGAAVAALMLANHETGVVFPVAETARRCAARGVPLVCDAALGPGRLDVRVEALGAELVALSAHKANGPRGLGVLYVRRRTRLAPVLRGGVQEERVRPGTEDVAAIVGGSVALAKAQAESTARAARYAALGSRLATALAAVGGVSRVGPDEGGLPGLVAVEVAGCEGEALLVNLDLEGVAVSTGSACAVGATDPSPVLLAMGFSKKRASSTLRFSVGEGVDEDAVDAAARRFAAIVARLRALAR